MFFFFLQKWTFSLEFDVDYATSDQKEHCPSDISIWSVLTTNGVSFILAEKSGIHVMKKIHCDLNLFSSGNMTVISKQSVKVSNQINKYDVRMQVCHSTLVHECCSNLEIQSNNSLCVDAPEACGKYHLEYIDANGNPVYKNDKDTSFLYYDLQGQVQLKS